MAEIIVATAIIIKALLLAFGDNLAGLALILSWLFACFLSLMINPLLYISILNKWPSYYNNV